MDIKIPLPTSLLTSGNNPTTSLSLQLNQQLDVKIVDAKTDQNTLVLQLANKIIQVQASQPLNVLAGQTLGLQVIKLQPLPEFKVVSLAPQQPPQTAETTVTKNADIILKPVAPQTNINSQDQTPKMLNQLLSGQHIQIKLIEVTDKSLTGQLISSPPLQQNASKQESNQVTTLPHKQIANLQTLTDTQTNSKTNIPLAKTGQIITLEVIKPGNQPQFKLVDSKPEAVREQIIAETFKRYLPIQKSPAVLFDELIKQLPELERNENIPETLKKLAREILQNLPHKSHLTNAETLKQQILNSGRFLEANLIQLVDKAEKAEVLLQGDLKLKLLKLVDYLKQQPEPKAEQKTQANELSLIREILQKSTNSLATIILDQLNSLPKEEGNKQIWSLDLPFLNNDQTEKASIEIEQDLESGEQEQKNNWSVNITISPPELGTIHCKLCCYDLVVSTRFWSENPSTVVKINSHLDYLKQQLENNGIKPGLMDVQQGKPEHREPQKLLRRNLLNEQA